MFMRNFEKHLVELKKKDEIAIKKADRRLHSAGYDYNFYCRVTNIYDVFMQQVAYTSTVLKEYIDNPLGEYIFGRPFSEAVVRSVLMDKDFVASMFCSKLMARALKLERTSPGQVKLRVYIAILNYDRYKKEHAVPRRLNARGKKITAK